MHRPYPPKPYPRDLIVVILVVGVFCTALGALIAGFGGITLALFLATLYLGKTVNTIFSELERAGWYSNLQNISYGRGMVYCFLFGGAFGASMRWGGVNIFKNRMKLLN